ncbi:hypothetical protein AX15_003184 [Amanita polypyramis BW_CC]|nr:hypothetical protein AX15_003184 [Amanita polypyramis BW_CC]
MKHRDVKEDNFVFHGTGANRKAELIDWGLAKYVETEPLAKPPKLVDVTSSSDAKTIDTDVGLQSFLNWEHYSLDVIIGRRV